MPICPIHLNCSPISPEGDGTLGILVVGDYCGIAEAADGLPFRPRGESGSVLERAWRRLGLSRNQFRLTNCILCQPPGKVEGSTKVALLAHYRPDLERLISEMKPRAILVLGGLAAEQLTGMSGRKQGIASIRGYIIPSVFAGIPVICSFHPTYLRSGKMSLLGVLINDIALAVRVAQNGWAGRPTLNYKPYATIADAKQFLLEAKSASSLAYDIETQWSGGEDEHEVVPAEETTEEEGQEAAKPAIQDGDPILTQFSTASGTGIALPPSGDYVPIIQALLQLPLPKLGFNSRLFDDGKLAKANMPVTAPKVDVMWAFHHLEPDLPRSLQSVVSFYCPEFGPWKHESGIDINRYGCKDVDVLQRVWPRIESDLRSQGLWDGYCRYVRDFMPILDRMSERGLPMDREEQSRFSLFLDEGLASADARMQQIVPDKLRNCSPKEGYVKDPGDVSGMVQRGFIAQLPITVYRYCDCVDLDTGEIVGWVKKSKDRCPECGGKGVFKVKSKEHLIASVIRWCKLLPFKPSSQQLITYMRFRGHKVPKAIGEDRESTAKLFLERMVKETKDPLYAAVLEYRAMQKMRSSYMWSIGEDGRVHPTFTNSPATGQLAAIAPNTLTIPASKGKSWKDQLAVRFRKTIAAPAGHVLLEVDASGFHVSTFALESHDPAYFRLANTIGDPHSFLTAIMLGKAKAAEMLSWDNGRLKEFLDSIKREYKPLRDGQAKPAILGYALGEGPSSQYERYRYDPDTGFGFKSKREAERLRDTLRATFPKGYQYQQDILQEAHRTGFLKSPYGFIRRFWDVLRHNPRTGEAEPGTQAEAVMAFRTQCNAHGYLKDALLRMEEKGYLERYNLINMVHDSVVFCVLRDLLEEAIANVVGEMERPSTVLRDSVLCPNGLIVKAEAKWGHNMAEMRG